MRDEKLTVARTITRITDDDASVVEDDIAVEMPLTLMINGEEAATIVCSPGYIRELVFGVLASEGFILRAEEVTSYDYDAGKGFVHIKTSRPVDTRAANQRFIGSCCGKSRQFYFKNDVSTSRTVMSRHAITADQCFEYMEALKKASSTFADTGGVHNAALFIEGEAPVIRTDIGRHNALDRLYGHILLNKIKTGKAAIAFSGRMSSEVLLKISKMGIGILLSKSAPTDLALDLANDLNITTAGFIRGKKMNIYTHEERIGKIHKIVK